MINKLKLNYKGTPFWSAFGVSNDMMIARNDSLNHNTVEIIKINGNEVE